MDLYSAAKRLSDPFVFRKPSDRDRLPIGARGIIGDGFSAALVRIDGVIDWLCLPRFDSPSCFGAILDPEKGGSTSIGPVSYPFDSLQRYDPDTNVLETLFRVPGQGMVRLTDYMPWTDDPRSSIHEVHRRVQCVEGQVDMVAIFDPRFDYGATIPRIEQEKHGVIAKGHGTDNLAAVLSGGVEWEPCERGGVQARFRIRSGERRWMVLSWNAPRPEPISAYRPFEHLRATRNRWRDWTRSFRYDGPWRHHVMRSALVLKLLMYAPTGAMVAAPTTSLPEWLGGVRNWDYRYSWTRDSAMAIHATSSIGYLREARDFFHFVRDILEHNVDLQIMYGIDGGQVPKERLLDHLSGFSGSAPVRIGNDAREQVQLDTAGALLDAAHVYERGGGSLTVRAWRRMREVVETVRRRWQEPDHGIWEPRATPRHNVHSRLMSWLALRRGAELAPLFGDAACQGRWLGASVKVHSDICTHGLDANGKHFVAAYGYDHADAALLLLPIHGFLEPQDPRILRTIDWVREELGTGPYLHRYRTTDGVDGSEGSFVLCGFWLAEALAMAGRIDEAQEIFTAHAEQASNHLGLLSEEVDPGTLEVLGNFPQAFSHLGLINAATRIDQALQLADEGSHRVPQPTLPPPSHNQ